MRPVVATSPSTRSFSSHQFGLGVGVPLALRAFEGEDAALFVARVVARAPQQQVGLAITRAGVP